MDFSLWFEDFIDTTVDFLEANALNLLCFILYFFLSYFLLGASWGAFFLCVLFYAVSIAIALSPVADWLLRLLNNARPIETREEKDYLYALFDDVLETASEKNRSVASIKLYIQDSMSVNACAIANRTICVTKGAIETFSEDELKSVLLHEIAHITYNHTRTKLLMLVGNGFFSVFVLIARTVLNVLDMINNANQSRESIFIALFFSILRFIFETALFACMFLFNIASACNSRSNEFQADRFAYACGYGEDFVKALYLLQTLSLNENMKLVERMLASHPRISKRIERIEALLENE